jgi:hypothetical protein
MADQSSAPTKSGKAVRDFRDAETGAWFEEGKNYDFEAGAHANYLHAGLIADPAPATPAKPAA